MSSPVESADLTGSGVSGPFDGREISVWASANMLLRRAGLVFGVPVVIALVVGVGTFLRPREYLASGSFVPQEAVQNRGSLGLLATEFGLPMSAMVSSSPQFYADLLQSREVLRDVVLTSYQQVRYPKYRGNLIMYLRVNERDPERALGDAVVALRKLLSVRTDRSTGIVRLEVHTKDPLLSVQIVRRLLDLVNEYNLQRRQSQGRAEREFVEERLMLAQRALQASEDSLATFYNHNRRFQDSPELVAREERLQRQVALRQQLYLTLSQSYETAKIEEVRNTPVITVIEAPEGFTQRRSRGTIRNTLLAFLGAATLAVAVALAVESASPRGVRRSPEYLEFSARWRAILVRLGRPLGR